MLAATARKKYQSKSIPWLLNKATAVFNAWVRLRDSTTFSTSTMGECISCGNWKELQAGHYYAAGKYSNLRFDEMNVNGQCVRCNYHLHGNLENYRLGLIRKYGEKKVEDLEIKAGWSKRNPWKWNRFELIEIILKYKS